MLPFLSRIALHSAQMLRSCIALDDPLAMYLGAASETNFFSFPQ